jgi:T5SS/PEP-CTERM-associated repeat protein
VPGGIDWFGAESAASALSYQGINGNLVTLTTQQEDNFVFANLGGNSAWLGGFQPPGSPEPAGGWQWITGEPWNFTHWGPFEPNNSFGTEDGLAYHLDGNWNDATRTGIAGGYIVEFGNVPQIISQWTFEAGKPGNPVSAGGNTLSGISPAIGNGIASGFHASAATVWDNPAGNGSTESMSSNNWALGDYYQFRISTVDLENITLNFEQVSSTSGPRDFQLQYSTDGTVFTDFGAPYSIRANANPPWSVSTPTGIDNYSFDLSSIGAINDLESVFFRLTVDSNISSNGGTIGTGGTSRLDNVTFMGTQILVDPYRNEWLNSTGGDYGDGSNWSKGQPPTPEETAIFNLGSDGYTITAFGPVWSPGLLAVQTDQVTLDFGNATWNNANFSDLRVGTRAGDQGELTIASGDLIFNQLMIGRDGGQGKLTVTGPASNLAVVDLGLASNNLDIAIGRSGIGELLVSHGGSLSVSTAVSPNASQIYVGVGVGGEGLLEVRDPNSTLAVGGLTIGGQGAHGRMNVRNGGMATVDGFLFVSENQFNAPARAEGTLEVSGENSHVSSARQIQIGRNGGIGSVVVSDGGRLESSIGTSATGTSGIIAWLNAPSQRSQGSVLVTGQGSTWVNEGLVVVGWEGDATLDIEQGGSVHSRRGQLGRITGAVGSATIEGAGSTWMIEQDLEVGSGGTGTLAVSSGGRVGVGQKLQVGSGGSVNVAGGGAIDVGQTTGQSLVNSVNVGAGGTLTGTGSIVGNVAASGGLVQPVWALTVDGNYTQSAASVLETRVGGLMAGAQYDRIVVTGSATLGGQLDIPLVGGYVPQLGDSVTILNALNVTGKFASIYAPDLPNVSPNLALAVFQNPTDVQLQFVEPLTNIQFNPTSASVEWGQAETWSTGVQPDSRHIIQIANSSGGDQRLNIQAIDAFVHELVVSGDATHTTTVALENGRTLSATARVVLNSGAVFDLGSVESPGTLTTPNLILGPGAQLKGSARVGQKKSEQKKLLEKRNELANRGGTLRPGRSVGQIEIDGNYVQELEGILEIELASSLSFDKVIVEGAATLGGTLDVVLLDFMPQLGDTFDFMDWETVSGQFDFVNLPSLTGGLAWDLSQLYATGSLSVIQAPGDFNGDGHIDGRDLLDWQRNPSVGALSDWQANYGNSSLNAAVSVPEPGSSLFCLFAMLTCLGQSRRSMPTRRASSRRMHENFHTSYEMRTS